MHFNYIQICIILIKYSSVNALNMPPGEYVDNN